MLWQVHQPAVVFGAQTTVVSGLWSDWQLPTARLADLGLTRKGPSLTTVALVRDDGVAFRVAGLTYSPDLHWHTQRELARATVQLTQVKRQLELPGPVGSWFGFGMRSFAREWFRTKSERLVALGR